MSVFIKDSKTNFVMTVSAAAADNLLRKSGNRYKRVTAIPPVNIPKITISEDEK